jgi:hypothetical protein
MEPAFIPWMREELMLKSPIEVSAARALSLQQKRRIRWQSTARPINISESAVA